MVFVEFGKAETVTKSPTLRLELVAGKTDTKFLSTWPIVELYEVIMLCFWPVPLTLK